MYTGIHFIVNRKCLNFITIHDVSIIVHVSTPRYLETTCVSMQTAYPIEIYNNCTYTKIVVKSLFSLSHTISKYEIQNVC